MGSTSAIISSSAFIYNSHPLVAERRAFLVLSYRDLVSIAAFVY